MSATILGQVEEKDATSAHLKKVHSLEHDLECKDHCLDIEQVERSKLESDVAQKEQLATNLLEVQRKEAPSSLWWRIFKG